MIRFYSSNLAVSHWFIESSLGHQTLGTFSHNLDLKACPVSEFNSLLDWNSW